jgi:peptidyl-tRNA hydrolase
MMRRIKILARKNLRMSEGKLAAQCVHAALGLYKAHPGEYRACIVLPVSDSKFAAAKAEHPEAYVVSDAGHTEVAPGTETALAFYEREPEDSQ